MCGITGILAFNLAGRVHAINLSRATDLLSHRGPDHRGTFIRESCSLGHRRLSVIDLSPEAAQPMSDLSGRYTIVYNGEVYNYREIRHELIQKGHTFRTRSDTEVLLQAWMEYGSHCLDKLNGFFAFAIYDEKEHKLFMARDRFGIKPLYYYIDEDKFIFASEMQSVLAYGLEKELNYEALHTYLQFNYIPAPGTILENIHVLLPGHFAEVKDRELRIQRYYDIPYDPARNPASRLSYDRQQQKLTELMEVSVQRRLVSDVPLGTFLSGGIDSSVISTLAKRHKEDLRTFSIGYADEPFFDETEYAKLVAKKIGSDHTVFKLTNDELYENLFSILDRFDQPFADSSAIPVYILSQLVSKEITVALSGDGADELFSGYNKHSAFYRSLQGGWTNRGVKALEPLWKILPKSRNRALTNRFRQLHRFAAGLKAGPGDRYWMWAALMSGQQALGLLTPAVRGKIRPGHQEKWQQEIFPSTFRDRDFNRMLLADMKLVLPDDMLKKVDLMSMAHGLEMRVPFLDHELVNFAFTLPVEAKINGRMKKRILQDAFREILPAELYNRPKHGFEVPLLKWFRTSLRSTIENDLLSDRLIEEQGIFDVKAVRKMKRKLFSWDPGDVHAHIWALVVFQWWWKKYFS